MSVFKILIGAVVVVVLLYFIMTLFVLPKSDIFTPIANSTKSALLQPGNPVCGNVNLPKNFSMTNFQLQNNSALKDLNIFFWLNSFNSEPIISANFESGIILKTKSALPQEDYCVTCYPGIIFYDIPIMNLKNEDYFCQVSFGKKLLSISANLSILPDTLKQGDLKLSNPFYKSSLNPDEYNYYFFVIPTNSKSNFSLTDLVGLKFGNELEYEQVKKFSYSEINEKDVLNIALPNAGNKLIVQAIIGKNKNPFSLEPMLSADFSVSSVEVLPNKEYQSQNCVATTMQKEYKNLEKNMCVVYNKCEGCSLPTYCAEAWKEKGVDAESKQKDFAISYLPIEECN